MPENKPGTYHYIGQIAGRIVSMIEFKGKIYVASEFGVYVLEGDKLVKLEFVDADPVHPRD